MLGKTRERVQQEENKSLDVRKRTKQSAKSVTKSGSCKRYGRSRKPPEGKPLDRVDFLYSGSA
jgi:hypothetical protein